MRQIGSLQSPDEARIFADYLLTRGITSKLDPGPDGVVVWIREEDQLPRAKEELAGFQADPTAERFHSAAASAQHIRQEARRREEQYRRQMIDMRGRWGGVGGLATRRATVAIIALSAGLTLLSDWGSFASPLTGWLAIERIHVTELGRIVAERDLTAVREGQFWRLFTPALLHGSILHLLFNMIWLYDLGGLVESRRGSLYLVVFVLVTGIFSNVAQYLLHLPPDRSPFFLGMSGVVYALFGFVWMKSRYDPRSGMYLHPNTVFWMIAWFVACAVGLIENVANVAHGAGLVAGVLIGYAPIALRRLKRG